MYYDFNTKNKSFLDMYNYLKEKGIKNNKFFLAIKNKDLIGVNPHSKNLTTVQKHEILNECVNNYWYFIREVIRIPDGNFPMYNLHRGNLAFNFCVSNNLNIIYQSPMLTMKAFSIVMRLLWEYNFRNINSNIDLMSSGGYSESRLILRKIKYFKSFLPEYLIVNELKDNKDFITHCYLNNTINAKPMARNEKIAIDLARSMTSPRIYMQDFTHIKYNNIIYNELIPIFTKTSFISKDMANVYGIIIDNIPCKINSPESGFAYKMYQNAVQFSELFYDLDTEQLQKVLKDNSYNNFITISYNYKELGLDEDWFKEKCKLLNNDPEAIKHEILLEYDWGE